MRPIGTEQTANFGTSTTCVVDTGGKFATGAKNTGGKFAAGVHNCNDGCRRLKVNLKAKQKLIYM